MKRTMFLLLAIIMIFSLGVTSFAQGVTTTETTQTTTASTKDEMIDKYGPSQEDLDALTANVSMEDASAWAERKGFEVIGFLQKFVQPFAIIMFILFAFLVLVGAFGNGQLVSKGIWGMAIALIMYAVVLYAPEIMDMFLAWVRS